MSGGRGHKRDRDRNRRRPRPPESGERALSRLEQSWLLEQIVTERKRIAEKARSNNADDAPAAELKRRDVPAPGGPTEEGALEARDPEAVGAGVARRTGGDGSAAPAPARREVGRRRLGTILDSFWRFG